jgi:hypothetical protein
MFLYVFEYYTLRLSNRPADFPWEPIGQIPLHFKVLSVALPARGGQKVAELVPRRGGCGAISLFTLFTITPRRGDRLFTLFSNLLPFTFLFRAIQIRQVVNIVGNFVDPYLKSASPVFLKHVESATPSPSQS